MRASSLIIIQYSTQVVSRSIIPEKGIKGIQITKEEIKLYLLADGMLFYISEHNDSTRKLIYQINADSKVVGYKINMQK